MSGGPLDVALRVRFHYDGSDGARRAVGDVETIARKAQQLGGGAGGDKLARDLRTVSAQAQIAGRDLSHVAATATRLDSGSTVRLAGDLRAVSAAGSTAARGLAEVGQVAARFGATSTVAYLARDLRAAQAPALALQRDMVAVSKAVDGIGSGRALATLDRDLVTAARRADDLERRLIAVARHTGGRGAGMEFGNEAMRAAGLGLGGLRLGMGGAAAGGLALGAGVSAVGGGIAAATRQAIDFQHAMTEVGKAIGSGPGGMRDLESQFLALSRKSGIRSTEIAGIAAQGGYFNIPRDQIPGFTDISTRAAVGFQMRPDEAAEALGPLMKSYRLKDNGALRLAGDAINTIGDSVGVRERNILNYLNRTSGVSGMENIPLEKNAAIGGAVQSLGVAPDVAATSVQQVFSRLSNANLEGKEFQRGLRGIHMSGRQAKAMMDQDATGGLLTVLERIKDLDHGKRANVIRDMFGEGEIASVSRMAESLDVIKEALDKVSDPSKYRGSLEKTFKIFSSDTTASINRAGTALESLAIKVGQRFDPAVRASADLMARWLGGVTKAMERGDRAEALARKMAKGEPVSPAERAQADADPRLKRQAEQRSRELMERALPIAPEEDRPALERRVQEGRLRDLEGQIGRRKARGLDASDLERQLGAARGRFRELYPAEGDGMPAPLPGTGKRSDLQDGVKASLASYHEEVEQSLSRTERLAREMGRRITEDLTIRPKVQDAAFRFGGEGGARIERASLGGGGSRGFGGGLGGGGSGGGGSGGFRGMPGRFGGAVPVPHDGGRRFEGGRAGGGSGLTGPHIGTPGSGSGMPDPGANPGAYKEVLDHIARSEGTAGQPGGGYNTSLAYGKLLPGGVEQNLTGKTLDQVDALQTQMLRNPANRWNSSAIGRYQIVRTTLRGLRKKLGLRGDEMYDERMQDRLGAELARARGADPRALGQEWASLHGEKGQQAAELMRRVPRDASTAPSGVRPTLADAARTGQAGGNGQFDPLGGAARRYSSGFGMREHPVHGGRRMHYGQDMAAPAGSPVSAMQGGRVTAISRMGDVTVTHPDGSTKTYRHIDPSGVRVGQPVEGGAQIGTLRAHDPRSTGPHLHLEATDAQGRRYDPRAEIDEAGRPNRAVAERAQNPGGDAGPRQMRPWSRRQDAPEPRSPRFMDPSSYQLKPGAGGAAGAGGPGMGRFGLSGPSVVQHFHTGADAHEVGRRAQLEQNREIRRNMAGALHDVGHPVSV